MQESVKDRGSPRYRGKGRRLFYARDSLPAILCGESRTEGAEERFQMRIHVLGELSATSVTTRSSF